MFISVYSSNLCASQNLSTHTFVDDRRYFNQISFWKTTISIQHKAGPLPLGQFYKPEKILQEFLKKPLHDIPQDDIKNVCHEVLKQVAELSHKTKDQQCFYDNLNGKKKLVNINSQELFIPSVFDLI